MNNKRPFVLRWLDDLVSPSDLDSVPVWPGFMRAAKCEPAARDLYSMCARRERGGYMCVEKYFYSILRA